MFTEANGIEKMIIFVQDRVLMEVKDECEREFE